LNSAIHASGNIGVFKCGHVCPLSPPSLAKDGAELS
jgi:hypothetical protein